ncbi:diguanylate cyclase [Alteromonas sp. 1036]
MGIDRFDGKNFMNYGDVISANLGLTSSYIYDMAVDPESGDMWIATMTGLNSISAKDGKVAKHALVNKNDVDNIIRKIFIDDRGKVWIGSSKSLYYLDPQKGFIKTNNFSAYIYDITTIFDDYLAIATTNGLFIFDPLNNLVVNEYLKGKKVTKAVIDNNDILWVGTNGEGLHKFKLNSNRSMVPIEIPLLLEGIVINDILQMKDDSIWIATSRGIHIAPDGNYPDLIEYNHYGQAAEMKTYQYVHKLFQLNDGKIAYGTLNDGLFITAPRNMLFKSRVYNDDASTKFVYRKNDNLWLISDDGVHKLDENLNTIQSFNMLDTQNKTGAVNKFISVYESEKTSDVWLATRLGLGKIPPNGNIKIVAFDDVPVYTVRETSAGYLLVGSYDDGLFLYDPKQNRVMHRWPFELTTSILNHEDPNYVFVATINGLHLINLETFEYRSFRNDEGDPESLPINVVTWISKKSKNEYFVGTQGAGLSLMTMNKINSPPSFKRLFANSRLGVLSIGAVVQDDMGNYWVSTAESIARINPSLSNLELFDKFDGASSTGYYIGAHAKLDSGEILFAGGERLTYFNPIDIRKDTRMPVLKLTKVEVVSKRQIISERETNHPITLSPSFEQKSVVLKPDDIILNIEVAALEFGSPEAIQYAYRLIGFDSRWQTLNKGENGFMFTNLSPGEYSLQVRSTNRYGEWNPNWKELKVVVDYPWWKTIYAIALWIILGLGFIYFCYRWRTAHLLRRSKELEELIQSRTLDLAKANMQLRLLATQDPLTGTYNRRGFYEVAKRAFSEFARAEKLFSLVLIDVDFFKDVNDSYGHEVGDKALVEIANDIKSSVRKQDVVARWGGEEFVILIPNASKEEAASVAEKLRMTIAGKSYLVNGVTINLTITCGVSCIDEKKSIDATLRHADALLYQGKQEGRNCVIDR